MRKNRLFMMGTLAVMLAFGLVLVGCDDDSGSSGGGGGGGGGGVPSELVGKWYNKAADVLVFEFTAENKFIMQGQTFDASVSGKTVTIGQNGNVGGTFDYSISGSEMTITNGTIGCASFPSFFPLIKK